MNAIQPLVDDAVADLLKKHHHPVTLKDALPASTDQQSEKPKHREAR
jgi:hypothetical protein